MIASASAPVTWQSIWISFNLKFLFWNLICVSTTKARDFIVWVRDGAATKHTEVYLKIKSVCFFVSKGDVVAHKTNICQFVWVFFRRWFVRHKTLGFVWVSFYFVCAHSRYITYANTTPLAVNLDVYASQISHSLLYFTRRSLINGSLKQIRATFYKKFD